MSREERERQGGEEERRTGMEGNGDEGIMITWCIFCRLFQSWDPGD